MKRVGDAPPRVAQLGQGVDHLAGDEMEAPRRAAGGRSVAVSTIRPWIVAGSLRRPIAARSGTPGAAVTGGEPTRSIGGAFGSAAPRAYRLRHSTWGGEAPGVRAADGPHGRAVLLLGASFGFLSAATPDAAVRDEDLLVIVSVLTAALALALCPPATGCRSPGFHLVAVLGTALASVGGLRLGDGLRLAPCRTSG